MINEFKAAALLVILTLLSGCTSQRLFNNEIYLFNSCGQALQIVVANDSNIDLPERTLTISPGSRELIGLYHSSSQEDVIGQVQDAYKLRITSSDGVFLQIDGHALRNHLQQLDKLETGSTRIWVINDLSFCPGEGKLGISGDKTQPLGHYIQTNRGLPLV